VQGRRFLFAFFVCLAACVSITARSARMRPIIAGQANDHVNETAKVCGQVASVRPAFRTRRQPAYLNFEKPYPHQELTSVIWGLDRCKFGEPEKQFRDERICTSGLMKAYRGRPKIALHIPKQVAKNWAADCAASTELFLNSDVSCSRLCEYPRTSTLKDAATRSADVFEECPTRGGMFLWRRASARRVPTYASALLNMGIPRPTACPSWLEPGIHALQLSFSNSRRRRTRWQRWV
jgi:hypothetical protein